MRFKTWLESSTRDGAHIGLYPPIEDALGQYPPLYTVPSCSSFVYYLWAKYKGKIPGDNGKGIITYPDEHAPKSI